MSRALRSAASLASLAALLAACTTGVADPFPGATAKTTDPAPAIAPSAASTAGAEAPASAAPRASAAPARIAADPAAAARVSALAKDPPHPLHGRGKELPSPVDTALDGGWITQLASAEITSVTPNRGGSSISMRVKLADGRKAALKPEQTGKPTDPRAEIAGYHVDRILGFHRSAAVVGRRFSVSDLRAALVASGADAAFLERIDGSLVVKDGFVDAAMIAWHTKSLVEEEAAPAWASSLEAGEEVSGAAAERLAEWSDLIVFDFLIDNPDRHSGGNVLRLDRGGPLIFLDQGAAFGKGRLRDKLTTKDRLDKVCRFRKATLAALAASGPQGTGALLRASLARDPIAPVLDDAQIAGVEGRAAALAAHVSACAKKLGPAASLAPH